MPNAAFDYRVRVSPRGRNVRLRVTVRHGLEVVIPQSYDPEKVPSILERKKSWIHAALERAESQRKFFEPEPSWKLPSDIRLPAVGKMWHVTPRPTESGSVVVREIGDGRLSVF